MLHVYTSTLKQHFTVMFRQCSSNVFPQIHAKSCFNFEKHICDNLKLKMCFPEKLTTHRLIPKIGLSYDPILLKPESHFFTGPIFNLKVWHLLPIVVPSILVVPRCLRLSGHHTRTAKWRYGKDNQTTEIVIFPIIAESSVIFLSYLLAVWQSATYQQVSYYLLPA